MIYCLNVPHHTLYVRRNGRPSWNGNTPFAVICQLSPRGQFRVIDELCAENMGVRNFASDIVKPHLMNKYPQMPVVSIGDPAGGERAQSDETTCMQMLLEAGLPTQPASTQLFIPRREAVVRFLSRMVDGDPGFIVSPNCTVIRKGFQGRYRYRKIQMRGADDRYAERPEKNHPWSDGHDALQYIALHAEDAVVTADPSQFGGGGGNRRKVKVANAKGWT